MMMMMMMMIDNATTHTKHRQWRLQLHIVVFSKREENKKQLCSNAFASARMLSGGGGVLF
jgi:hypothetical protein